MQAKMCGLIIVRAAMKHKNFAYIANLNKSNDADDDDAFTVEIAVQVVVLQILLL